MSSETPDVFKHIFLLKIMFLNINLNIEISFKTALKNKIIEVKHYTLKFSDKDGGEKKS